MAEEITVARPYAEAAYRLAMESGRLADWSRMLAFAAAAVADPQMQAVIGNPKFTADVQKRIFLAVCDRHLDDQGKNLVALLIDNRRLLLLPAIREQFERLKAEHGGVLEATIVTAFPLADADRRDLIGRLEAKFNRKVDATLSVDPELIGGIRIVAGDVVIDASVRGQLQNMAYTLKR
jgi:F-type H+-transporting ATPase subunit delta